MSRRPIVQILTLQRRLSHSSTSSGQRRAMISYVSSIKRRDKLSELELQAIRRGLQAFHTHNLEDFPSSTKIYFRLSNLAEFTVTIDEMSTVNKFKQFIGNNPFKAKLEVKASDANSPIGFLYSKSSKFQEISSTLASNTNAQQLQYGSDNDKGFYLREIAFPHDLTLVNDDSTSISEFFSSKYPRLKGFPFLFNPVESTTSKVPCLLRVTPLNYPTIVVYNEDFEEMKRRFDYLQIDHELIYGNHSFEDAAGNEKREEQIQLTILERLGIDLRFSNCKEPTMSFIEGSSALLHGKLPEIQSTRVLGGDETLVESKYGHFGDCWSEARAIVKNQVLGSVDVTRTAKSKVSKLPSILE